MLVAAAATLASCAMFQAPKVAPGTSLADTVQRLGPPSAEYRLGAEAAGDAALRVDTSGRAVRRLEYTAGSFGSHTWMLDFDASDRLLASAQVRNEARFAAIRPGMDQAQVRRGLGLPSNTTPLARGDLRLWSYRYESPLCVWFQVSVDAAGKVAEAGYGPDPLCTSLD